MIIEDKQNKQKLKKKNIGNKFNRIRILKEKNKKIVYLENNEGLDLTCNKNIKSIMIFLNVSTIIFAIVINYIKIINFIPKFHVEITIIIILIILFHFNKKYSNIVNL